MWPNPQETVDLVTFNEEILNEKLHFLRSVKKSIQYNCFRICPTNNAFKTKR